jgi:hypothetical protein
MHPPKAIPTDGNADLASLGFDGYSENLHIFPSDKSAHRLSLFSRRRL